MGGAEAMKCSVKDTFYIDPRVEGCDDLATRAKRLGLRTRGFLGAGVTVCVVATTAAAAAVAGEDRTAEEAAAAATVNPKYSRRRDRIHRMVSQAQSEPEPEPEPESKAERARQPQASITDHARRLHALVLPGQAFRLWLEGLESKGAAGGKGKAAARPLISRTAQGAGTSRFKSQEHPRVVIRDMDGLEPDRVQAFPPELLRKCNLHPDAPPGICPFTPREQWEREALRVKKKDAQSGAGKVADRTPPGPRKARRGGWCECCGKKYIGTMSEHCAGEQHRISVAADPNFEVLLALQSWTAADDEIGTPAATREPEENTAAAARGGGHGRIAAVAPQPFGSAAAVSSAILSATPMLAARTSASPYVVVAAAAVAAAASAAAAAAPAGSTVGAKTSQTTATDASQSLPTRRGAGGHLAVIGLRNDAHPCDTAPGSGAADVEKGAETARPSGGIKDPLPGHRNPAALTTSRGFLPPSPGPCGSSPTRLAHGGGHGDGEDPTAKKENVRVAAPAPPPSPSRRRGTAVLQGASAPGSSPQRRRCGAPAPRQPAVAIEGGRPVSLGEGREADQPEAAASVHLQRHLVDADGLKPDEVDASVPSPGRSRPFRGGGDGGSCRGGRRGGGGDGGGRGGRDRGGQERQTGCSARGGGGEPRPVSENPANPANGSPIELRRKSRQERALEQLADSPEFVGVSARSSWHEQGRGRRGEGRGGRTTRLGLGGSASSAGGGGDEVSSPGTAQEETRGGASGCGCSPPAGGDRKPSKRRRWEEGKRENEEEQGKGGSKPGLLSVDGTRESEQSRSRCAKRAAASADGRRVELRGGGRGSESPLRPSSSSPTAWRGAATDGTGTGTGDHSATGSAAEGSRGQRPKRTRKSPTRFRDKDEPNTANGEASCGSAKKSGKLSGARIPTPTTASRMGLHRPTDALAVGNEDGGGIGDCGGDRTPSTTPRRDLKRKFREEHVSEGEVCGTAASDRRTKRTAAIGELDRREPPPPKRARALIVATSSCTRPGTRRQ